MTKPSSHLRVLSIDPTSRGFGFAVLEDRDSLIDWGVVQARADKNRHCLDRIAKLIQHYRPRALVIEDTRRGTRRGPRVRRLLHGIEKLAAKTRTKLKRIPRRHVRLFFSPSGATTKHQIAEVIAKRFPELAPHLPPPRKPWNSEAAVMAVFDAVAYAVTLCRS